MKSIKFTCEDCETYFTIRFNEDLVDGPPCFCPWCSSYISDDISISDNTYDDYQDEYDKDYEEEDEEDT